MPLEKEEAPTKVRPMRLVLALKALIFVLVIVIGPWKVMSSPANKLIKTIPQLNNFKEHTEERECILSGGGAGDGYRESVVRRGHDKNILQVSS